ncbi:MAG: hypothetical protein JWO93_11 [Micrococcaceae bacterium]|nr:hypothetical protein [Micrococcaceae bacterium]
MSKQEDRTPVDAPGESGVQAPGRRRAADSLVDAPGRARPLEQLSGSTGTTSTDGLPSRRSLRRAQQSAALVSDATAQIARLQAAPGSDPSKVDPQVLAEQLALAERAAALNRRAGKSSPAPSDPTAAHNLGPAAAPAAPAATTTAVPPAGTAGPTTAGPSAVGTPAPAGPTAAVGSSPPGSTAGPTTQSGWQPSGSRDTKRRKRKPTPAAAAKATSATAAPASATAAPTTTPAAATGWVPVSGAARDLDDRTPLPAGSALGLDPLDAVTAGLGRTQRNRRISWGLAVVAVVALGTVLTLILTGFGH